MKAKTVWPPRGTGVGYWVDQKGRVGFEYNSDARWKNVYGYSIGEVDLVSRMYTGLGKIIGDE